MAIEAVIVVVPLNTTFLLTGIMVTGVHVAEGLLGIAISMSLVLILVRDALRVRIKLNDLDAARLPTAPELEDMLTGYRATPLSGN
jgi:hypothetical protein